MGVSIHRDSCASLQRLLLVHPERLLPVEWGGGAAAHYEVEVIVRALDRKSLLKDLTHVVAQQGINILGLQSRVDPNQGSAELRFSLKVADYEQLSLLLAKLGAVPGVSDARRLG